MRKIWYLMLVCLMSIPLLAATSGAWEFNLSGAINFELEALGQGPNHFFGPHNAGSGEADAAGGYRINFWPGLQTPSASPVVVSSSDARWRTQYAEFFPVIKINKAVSIHGSYYVGSWVDFGLLDNGAAPFQLPNIHDSEYVVKEYTGAHEAFSPGYWNWMRIKVKLPWGNLSLGKRPSKFGMGLMYEAYTAGSNSVSLSVPYGPLLIGISVYPQRRANHPGSPSGFTNDDDGSNIRLANWAWGATYTGGGLQTGFAVSHAERQRPAERNVVNYDLNTRYRHDLELKYFAKWNNGRFFFNGEIDAYYRTQISHFNRTGAGNQIFNDTKALVYGAEAGVYAGPAKFTLFLFNGTDDDRRAWSGGTDVFKANNLYAISPDFGNTYSVCYPYIYLMGFHYGGGNTQGQNPLHGRGRWTSGLLYAARLDYAVAANLNVYGSVAHATQWNKSFGWGYIGVQLDGEVTFARRHDGAVRSPAIPDDDMGWEFNAGVDWKLLEGLTLRVVGAYWQPGDWWKWACVSKTNTNWDTPELDTVWWGTDPNRSIDAVYGYNVMVTADF